MSDIVKTRITAIPWALKTGVQFALAWLRREPGVHEAALAFAQEHAKSGDPASVLGALDRFARERRFLMNVGDEKGPLLEGLIQKAGRQARVLELGSFVGYSAILIGRQLEAPGHLTSIDVSERASRVSRQMAELAGVGDLVDFVCGKSTEALEAIEEPFDVVFLDHWKALYKRDMEKILERKLLRPGAVVFADNVGPMFGKNEYVPWMQERADFESEYLKSHIEYQKIEDGVLISNWKGGAA